MLGLRNHLLPVAASMRARRTMEFVKTPGIYTGVSVDKSFPADTLALPSACCPSEPKHKTYSMPTSYGAKTPVIEGLAKD